MQSDSFGINELQKYRNIEDAIKRALVEHEFEMYYQPIISTQTGRVVSAEALIRLKDRLMGLCRQRILFRSLKITARFWIGRAHV